MDLLAREKKIRIELEHVLEKILAEYAPDISIRDFDYHDVTRNFIKDSGIIEVLNMACDSERFHELKEKGLLLQLPCKIGTPIYMIRHGWGEYIEEGTICGIAESDGPECFCFKVYCDPDYHTLVSLEDFNKDWFLSEDDAKQSFINTKGK